jgi:hypothetical protein
MFDQMIAILHTARDLNARRAYPCRQNQPLTPAHSGNVEIVETTLTFAIASLPFSFDFHEERLQRNNTSFSFAELDSSERAVPGPFLGNVLIVTFFREDSRGV